MDKLTISTAIYQAATPENLEELRAFGNAGPIADAVMAAVHASGVNNKPLNLAALATQPATSQEPFGYWVTQKHADPILLRKPAYIPEPSDLRTVTPLYAATLATVAAANDEGVALDWRAVAKLAGEHGVRYRTNTALEKFLAAIRLLSQEGGKA